MSKAKKGFIVRKTAKKIFVRASATAEEIKYVNDNYARLGWEIYPCKNEGKKPEKRKAREVNENLDGITYDDILKEELFSFVKQFLSNEEYTEFIKASYTIKKDKKGNEKPSYHHIKAKDFVYKLKFEETFKQIEARRNKKAKKDKELAQAEIDILSILKA